MAKYVLSEAAKRRFDELTSIDGIVRRNKRSFSAVSEFDLPFLWQVRYSASLQNGDSASGGWIIALNDSAVVYNGETIAVNGNGGEPLEEANVSYSNSGGYKWYVCPAVDNVVDIYLVIRPGYDKATSEEEKTTTAFLVDVADAEQMISDGNDDEERPRPFKIKIAGARIDDSSGFARITQIVSSAIVLNGDGTVVVNSIPEAFEYVDEYDETGNKIGAKIVRCSFYHNGELQTLEDFQCNEAGPVYLNCAVDHDENGAPQSTWSMGNEAIDTEDGESMSIKIYDIGLDGVDVDYRTTFLTVSSRLKDGFNSPEDKGRTVVLSVERNEEANNLKITREKQTWLNGRMINAEEQEPEEIDIGSSANIECDEGLKAVAKVEWDDSAGQIRITRYPIVFDSNAGKLKFDTNSPEYDTIDTVKHTDVIGE